MVVLKQSATDQAKAIAIELPPEGAPGYEPEVVERVLRVAREKANSAHHRLPQFYLKPFVGKAGRLEVLNPWTGTSELLRPKEAFAEEGYYTGLAAEMEPLALVEVLYEVIEDAAAKPARRLRKGASPTELTIAERLRVAEFLATQMTRGESFRRTTEEFVDEVGQTMMKMKAAYAEDWWPSLEAEAAREGDPLPADTPEQYRKAVEEGKFKMVPSPEHILNLRLVAVEQMAEIFAQCSWHCVRFEEPCLFTCEEPITYWREPDEASAFMGIGAETADEIRIALSPRVALVLVHPRWGFKDGEAKGGMREAALLNFGALFFRARFPIVRSPDVRCHPLPLALMPESRVMPQFIGGPVIRG
jgi:Protein of unknown function (DUF4238)